MVRGDHTSAIKGTIDGHLISASDHAQLQVGAVPRAGAENPSRKTVLFYFSQSIGKELGHNVSQRDKLLPIR